MPPITGGLIMRQRRACSLNVRQPAFAGYQILSLPAFHNHFLISSFHFLNSAIRSGTALKRSPTSP